MSYGTQTRNLAARKQTDERFPGANAPEGETFEQGLTRLAGWPKTTAETFRRWEAAVQKGWTAVCKSGITLTPQNWWAGGDMYFKKGDITLWQVREGWRVCIVLRGRVCGHRTLGLLEGIAWEYSPEEIAHLNSLYDKQEALEKACEGIDWKNHEQWLLGCEKQREIRAITAELLGKVPSTMPITQK
jgi:hypothetical protein